MMSLKYIFVELNCVEFRWRLKFLLIDSKCWQIMIFWGKNVLTNLDSVKISCTFLVNFHITQYVLSSFYNEENENQVSCWNSLQVINGGDWFAFGSSVFKYCKVTSTLLQYFWKQCYSIDNDSVFYWGVSSLLRL